MAGAGSPTRVVVAALLANLCIAIAKFVAFSFTRSSVMLAEGFHSVADTGNQVLMLFGITRATKAPDQDHPYGYGKETYFWSFVVALSIFSLGSAFAFYEGFHKLFEVLEHPPETIPSQTIALVVLAVSLVVEGASLVVAAKEYRKQMGNMGFMASLRESRAAAIITVLFEDAAACLGLVIALIGISLTAITGNALFDVGATLLIGVLLAVVAYFLGFMTKNLLIGQSAGPIVRKAIADAIEEADQAGQVVDSKTLHMGGDVIILNLEINFSDHLQTDEIETAIDVIEARVKAAVPQVKYIYIEAESVRRAGRAGASAHAEDTSTPS